LGFLGAGTGQPVNGAIPSLPSPTMPNFNMAAQTPNGQPTPSDPGVYSNGLPQSYPPRKYLYLFYNNYYSLSTFTHLKK
jgi:hypothetical protein